MEVDGNIIHTVLIKITRLLVDTLTNKMHYYKDMFSDSLFWKVAEEGLVTSGLELHGGLGAWSWL